MRVVLYPFYSQQDKRRDLFRPDSDSGVKLYKYMQGRLIELDHDAVLVVPPLEQCTEPVTDMPCIVSPPMELSNLARRLQWDPRWLRYVSDGVDLLLTQHEFLPYPMRCLRPNLRTMVECGIRPETAWPETAAMFPLAWDAADMVCCNSHDLGHMVQQRSDTPTTVWRFAFDEKLMVPRSLVRTVDVLFNARASSTNYSNHDAFIRAMQGTSYSIVMTDPTGYLRTTQPDCSYLLDYSLSQEEYERILHRSKVVVGLTDNGYGGYALMEAVAAGAIPVALRNNGYMEFLGNDWPYFCNRENIRWTVERAVEYGWGLVPPEALERLTRNVQEVTYQNAWTRAYSDMKTVMS